MRLYPYHTHLVLAQLVIKGALILIICVYAYIKSNYTYSVYENMKYIKKYIKITKYVQNIKRVT